MERGVAKVAQDKITSKENTSTKHKRIVTFVQERWNQVVQELHEIEGSEQPTWFKQAPHGLFLNVVVSNLIMPPNEILSNCIENRMQRSASYCTYCTVRVARKSQR